MATYVPSMSRRSTTHGDHYVGQYKRLESIGKGSFATVYRALHPVDGSLLAIKSVNTQSLNTKIRNNLTSEIDILKSIKHPHIVALVQCLESATHIHLVMEFCQLGDLATFVKKRDKLAAHPITAEMMRKYPNPPGQGFNEVVVRHFSKQLASALEYMRAKNLLHRDLKPQNLLLNPPLAWIEKDRPENRPYQVIEDQLVPKAGLHSLPALKIADFGFARVLPASSVAETLCGSPLYMAPEILRYEKYDAKADLWSVGTVLYELMVGRPPFRASNHVDLLRKIETSGDRAQFPKELIISNDMKSLIRGLLKKMPTERLSWDGYFGSPVHQDEIPGLVLADRPRVSSPAIVDEPIQTPGPPYQRRESIAAIAGMMEDEEPEQRPELQRHFSSPRTMNPYPAPLSIKRASPTTDTPRRPALLGHATAPMTLAYRPDRMRSHNVEAPKTGESPSPGTSVPKEIIERDRERDRERELEHHRQKLLERERERQLKEAREQAAQDVAFERDYVVVEKRAVEVNAFADEMAANPRVSARPSSSAQPGVMTRRATTQAVQSVSSAQRITPSRQQMQVAVRQEGPHGRKRSWEAKYPPINKITATSALAAALNTVNFRLAGTPLFAALGKGPSPPQGYPAYPALQTPYASPLLLSDSPKALSTDEDARVLAEAEERAHRSDVTYGFAEVKYKQLMPIAPSNDNALGIHPSERSEGNDGLTTEAVVEIAEEAIVLYIKTLSVLQNILDLALYWWKAKPRGISPPAATTNELQQLSLSHRSSSDNKEINQPHLARINSIVQWARGRFNDCFTKSEYAHLRLKAAQADLPPAHPGHPSNHPKGSDEGGNVYMTTGVTAEKLMYDRALEMNKSAALNELMNEDLPGCELAYVTAIRLLDAVLERDGETVPESATKHKDKANDKDDEGMNEEQRKSIMEIIAASKQRLTALGPKIAMRHAYREQARRNSATKVNSHSPTPPASQ